MASNIIQDAVDVLDYTASGTWTSGTPVAVGSAIVIPLADATIGQRVACQVHGRASCPKISAQAWTQGQQIFWNGSAMTNVQTGTLVPAGIAAAAAANPSSTGYVDLGVGIEADSDVGTLRADLASTTDASKGASLVGIRDAGTLYTATTVEAALAEVKAIADAAAPSADLASVATGEGASLIGIEDAGTLYTATDVEAALAEVKGIADAAAPSADLASVATGEGASLIGIEDAGGLYTATDVEAALAEVKGIVDPLESRVVGQITFAGADASGGPANVAIMSKTSGYTPAAGDLLLHVVGNVTATGAWVTPPATLADIGPALVDDGGTIKARWLAGNTAANDYSALMARPL